MALAEIGPTDPRGVDELARYRDLRDAVHNLGLLMSGVHAAYNDVVSALIFEGTRLREQGIDLSPLEPPPVADHPTSSCIVLESTPQLQQGDSLASVLPIPELFTQAIPYLLFTD